MVQGLATIVSLREGADVSAVRRALMARGQWVRPLGFDARGAMLLALEAHSAPVAREELASIDGVASVQQPESAHPLLDAQRDRVLSIGPLAFGPPGRGTAPALIAGPCAVESEAQIHRVAEALARMGVRALRGGAFKPRTSPYAFQGHGERALAWLSSAGRAHGLAVVTEVLAEGEVSLVAAHANALQIGSRNMQNFALLKAAGAAGLPVLLKRGVAASIEEWLLAGEYLLAHGAASVLLCERGVRGFDPSTRNLLDLGAVAHLAYARGLAVLVDPSHATGRRDLVLPLARAALAAGAAGVMLEVHDDPASALSDGPQALDPAALAAALTGGLLASGRDGVRA